MIYDFLHDGLMALALGFIIGTAIYGLYHKLFCKKKKPLSRRTQGHGSQM